MAEQQAQAGSFRTAASTAPEPEPDAGKPLPPMDDLVAKIPAPNRALLEELFRARFVTVKRVPASALRN